MSSSTRNNADHDHITLLAKATQPGLLPGLAIVFHLGIVVVIVFGLACQALPDQVQNGTVGRAPDAVIAHLMKTLRNHMLEETGHELHGRQGHGLPLGAHFLFCLSALL